MPFLSDRSKDHLIQAASNIISILHKPLLSTIPTLKASNKACNILLKLAIILKRVDKIPELKAVEEVLSPRVPITKPAMLVGNNQRSSNIIIFK